MTLEVTERGPHHKVVRTRQPVTNELGEVSIRTGHYTALADGMHYQAIPGQGPWLESEPLIEPHPQGATSQRTPIKALFQRNVATVGAIEITGPDQKKLVGHAIGVRWRDISNGNIVWVGTIRDSMGEIIAPNRLIWRAAFEGIDADLVAIVEHGSIEVNVVLRQSLNLPQNMQGSNARLEIVTEFLGMDQPQIRENIMKRESDPQRRAQTPEPDLIN